MARRARKRYRRGRGRRTPRRVRIASGLPCVALAPKDVVTGALTAVATETYRLLSVKLNYKWEDIAAVIDDGLEFGLAHSDYTAAEIEECLESQASIDLGDKTAQEQSNRLVRSLGTIAAIGNVAEGGSMPFNSGRPLKTRLNWLMTTGKQLSIWVRNGSGTIWTTGSSIQAQGDMYIYDGN